MEGFTSKEVNIAFDIFMQYKRIIDIIILYYFIYTCGIEANLAVSTQFFADV